MVVSNEIFSRERLAGYDPEIMSRSVALVVGAGALGQNTAQNLALSGIGEIRIVDKDEFEPHNRTRSPAFPLPDEVALLGTRKAPVVANKLRRLMTSPRPLMRYADNWIQELGDGAFEDVSVVVSCVDRPDARAYLSDKARLLGLPFVEGGFDGPNLTLTSFPPVRDEAAVKTPCWRCSNNSVEGAFSCDFYARKVEEAGFLPAIQSGAATLGGLQCEAAISSLHASGNEAYALDFNIRTGRTLRVKLSTDPLCPGLHCSLNENPRPLHVNHESTGQQLLEALTEVLNESHCVTFNSPFIWNAACKTCQQMTDVRCPSWFWMMNPHCEMCGGDFSRTSDQTINSPVVFASMNLLSTSHLLNLNCCQLGFAPLSLVQVDTDSGSTKFFQLEGSLDQLFHSGDEYDQQQ